VKIHGRDPQLLVKAHSYLGHAYAESRCSEQAYEHLITAKKRNEAYEETEQGREYQLYILKLLITNCLQNDRIEEATDYIQEAETICQTVQEEQGGVTMDYAHIKKSMGEAYTLKKKYKDAIECYLEVRPL
jgi:tetratricopeptide (TPR) repeat protein